MKKNFLAVMMLAVMAFSMISCGKTEETPVAEEPAETKVEKTEEPEATPTELTDDERATVFTDYVDGLTKLGGTTFKMNGNNDLDKGFYPTFEGGTGTLYWIYQGDKLITADFDSSTNKITFNTLAATPDKATEVTSTVSIDDFIPFNDTCKILFSMLDLTTGKTVIMIESRCTAYTYADGVNYHIYCISVADDGSLSLDFDEGLAGSGDDDITSEIRRSYNQYMGSNYDKDTFDDVFYNGNLLLEQENKPIHATINFQSETSKLADAGDWDSVNGVTEQLYGDGSSSTGPVSWGTGEFVTN